jgi:hypothetical protein
MVFNLKVMFEDIKFLEHIHSIGFCEKLHKYQEKQDLAQLQKVA